MQFSMSLGFSVSPWLVITLLMMTAATSAAVIRRVWQSSNRLRPPANSSSIDRLDEVPTRISHRIYAAKDTESSDLESNVQLIGAPQSR